MMGTVGSFISFCSSLKGSFNRNGRTVCKSCPLPKGTTSCQSSKQITVVVQAGQEPSLFVAPAKEALVVKEGLHAYCLLNAKGYDKLSG
jgi:hypothetical protein